jgi:hypothetical protein
VSEIYVLILIVVVTANNSVAVTTQEFGSQTACNLAELAVGNELLKRDARAHVFSKCVRKGP